MWHNATRELFDYWNALRGQRAAPERAEIDLAAIRGFIADMFMLDADASHRFPFVLSGTRVNALACAEQNGRSFLDLWAEAEQRNIAAMLLTVMDAACPLIATATAKPEGWQDHEVEILLLPLGRSRGHGCNRARILGLIAPDAQPSWLGLLPVENLKLRSVISIDEATEPRGLTLETVFIAGVPSARSERSGAPVKNVRHLRVFQGGRQIS